MAASPDLLAERYGARSSRRWVAVAVGAVVGLVFLSWLAWATVFHATPGVTSELVGWDVTGDDQVVARLRVDVEDGVTGECRLRAMAADHTVVGEVAFEVSAGDGRVVEQPIRTERRATSVERIGCTAPGQPRPR